MSVPPPVLPTRGSPIAPTPELSADPPPSLPRPILSRPVPTAAVAIVVVTALAALASAADPALGPGGDPHPALHGTLQEAVSIFAANGRLLIVPLLLVAGRWPTGRVAGPLGDVVVGAVLVVNPVTIGLALGRFPTALLPYLPHLPLEDAALAAATGAWLSRRLRTAPGRPVRSLAGYGAWTFTLTAVAALTETFLVPHAS